MIIFDEFQKAKQQLFDYFGYVEDWVVIPLEDSRKYYWSLTGEGYGDIVRFAEKKESLSDESGDHYESGIYTQRFLPKWVYRGKDYTMICTNPGVDGNKFLSIFSNDLEV